MSDQKKFTRDEHTINEHRWRTADGHHNIYVQEWGNNKGTPIIFLHGGPGAGLSNKHRDHFDPKKHYVIFFDQRGAGNSTPKGSTQHNTTDHLIDDIELIRSKLGLEKFALYGGSWGSTLALMYGISCPQRVSKMLISGIMLGTKEELDWFDDAGYRIFYPEVYKFYTKNIPKKYLDHPGAYLRQQILEKNSKKAAYHYTEGEGSIIPLDHRFKPRDYADYDISYARIIAHYISNNCFIKDGYILKNADKLTMPIHIVHGRYDMVCLPMSAYALHKALPNSELHWTLAGHSSSDRSNYDVNQTLIRLIF